MAILARHSFPLMGPRTAGEPSGAYRGKAGGARTLGVAPGEPQKNKAVGHAGTNGFASVSPIMP
jgi:hypothetical protein